MTKPIEWVRNTKTGTIGQVKMRYNRVTDGKAMVAVVPATFHHKEISWLASRCEIID